MKAKLRVIAATSALLVLSGCATMSSDECVTADWQTIGYEDGSAGYTTDRFSQHRKACASHGVTPNLTEYQAGRKQGLVEYCQPGRGFDVGASGGRYNGVCSVNLEPDFLDAYNMGFQLHSMRSRVNDATYDISAKKSEIGRIEDKISTKEAKLIASETTTEQRVLLLSDLKTLSERTGELAVEIEVLYEQRARYRVELETYQGQLADFGY